jgi:two-component system NtrC family sensor kinase
MSYSFGPWNRCWFPSLAVGLTGLGSLGLLLGEGSHWVLGVLLLGVVLCWVAMARLFFQLGRAERERALLDARMVQSHKLAALGELSAGIAHEINNPLAIIGREAEWMEHLVGSSSGGDESSRQEMLESIREVARQVDRCREITQNLLSFARKMEPVFQRVDVNRLVEDMVRLVERETQGHGIQIQREYGQDLQPIRTDPPGLRQVILNLLNNARQAMEQGGTIRVRTSATSSGGIQIAVQDTGCGIPQEHLPRIFDPFFTTKAQGKGTGLGLSICHGIVHRLGGRIWVRSQVGLGSTFVVELPSRPSGSRGDHERGTQG